MTNATAPAESITFTKIAHDTNGNPRYVCHFLNLCTREELDRVGDVGNKYAAACKRANTIGGRKYHTKRYGGGIVFQSYSLASEVAAIARVTGRNFTGYTCD